MTYSLIIFSSAGNKDYAETTTNVEYATNRDGNPSTLKFTVLKTQEANFHEGDRVIFSVDSQRIFVGFVFNKVVHRFGEIDVLCYDQLRYLKTNGSYVWEGVKYTDIIRQLADEFGLTVGTLDDTNYVIPYLLRENKELLDIVNHAIELTTVNTNVRYVLFDDAGKISVRAIANQKLNIVLGKASYVYDYQYETDIDSNTYNQIKLVRPNEDTGYADTYVYLNTEGINRWGLLQYYQVVDENMNPAQIESLGQVLLTYYNNVGRTIRMDALGVVGIRAGQMLPVYIPEIGDLNINHFLTIDNCTHSFSEGKHTMSLEMAVYLKDAGEIFIP